MKVTLTRFEWYYAAMIGVLRGMNARGKNYKPTYGSEVMDRWGMDIEGACGEAAAAKYLNKWFAPPSFGPQDYDLDDVAKNIEVRTTVGVCNRLILHEGDPDNHPFILVVGAAPAFELKGWIYGRDGKRSEFWEDPSGGNRWAFFVPQEKLNPMQTFPL